MKKFYCFYIKNIIYDFNDIVVLCWSLLYKLYKFYWIKLDIIRKSLWSKLICKICWNSMIIMIVFLLNIDNFG